ncbi:hypothetical protein JX265_004353 [Neoarthrinium moseri]|uniref:Uncharacterized protein n=1 Tax=Neoarthrinium moseri TaxID=1658444 RepID=A0A9Q0AR61_9PEZI|nr:uncharacterized protein JN550_001853 [Neoarthrinium moseri]KAI1850643.1 hypothetical protein JX266_003925 [Neoarthrinium moseri]KAI1875295.1 hypothetical protein JX265_004353 [Neoarthrinium moseri]KAI1875567.1 hypothetical protein JN550_001853 [Neoarthrinium moseri]
MLLVNPHELQSSSYYMNYRLPTPSSAPSVMSILNMASQHHEHHPAASPSSASDNEVAQALEIARESPDGAKDPFVSNILETALAQIWANVQAHPDSYIMSRDEFAVFNYFQHRFEGNKVAIAARKRYWDNATGV